MRGGERRGLKEEEFPGMVRQSNENNNGISTEYPEQDKGSVKRACLAKTRTIEKERKGREEGSRRSCLEQRRMKEEDNISRQKVIVSR